MNLADRIKRNQKIVDHFLKTKCSIAALARKFDLHRKTIYRALKERLDYTAIVLEKREQRRKYKFNKLIKAKKPLLQNDYLSDDTQRFIEWCSNEMAIIDRKKEEAKNPIKVPVKLFRF